MGFDLTIVAEGLFNALTFTNLVWLLVGVSLGLVSGTLPGLGGGTMMVILLPITTTLPVDTMLITLAAIYAANVYADSTTGILYNIPGGAAGIPATVEGYALNRMGRLEEAFSAQVSGSFFGATVGFFVLLLLVPTFIIFVKFFGSAERALLAVWALVFICSGTVTRDDPLRSFVSVGLGLALATIGQQPNIGTFRFTFGLIELWDGLKVVLLIMGVFAIPQIIEMSRMRGGFGDSGSGSERIAFFSLYRSMARTVRKSIGVLSRSSLLGVFVGIIPGIGTSSAAWVGYSVARNHTKLPEKFGEGNRDGILGAESASNACEVGTIVPLLALGIPGSAAGAIMLAALNMVGIHPGPAMYARHGVEVWTIMFGIGLSGVVFALLAYPFIKGAESMARLPVSILIGAIGTLCIMGAFLETQSVFGPSVMIVIGIVMVFGIMLGLKPAPLIIGFVLGPGIEKELIRAYQIGGFERFTAPASLVIIAIILVTLAAGLYRWKARSEDGGGAEFGAATAPAAQGAPRGEAEAALEFSKGKILAAIGIAVAALMLVGTLDYPYFASLWVYFVAIFFIAVPSLILMATQFTRIPASFSLASAHIRSRKIDIRSLGAPAIVFAVFFLFIALIYPLGFLGATATFCFCISLFLDHSPRRALLSAAGVAAMIWVVKTSFGFYLPPGLIGL